jgi:hypothetical protein
MSKLMTEWYPANIKPVHRGVYEKLDVEGKNGYQRWNGAFWSTWCNSPQVAEMSDDMSLFQNDPWRGFTKEQK